MIQVHEHNSKSEQPIVEDTVLDVSRDLSGTEAGTEPALQSYHSTTSNIAAYENTLLPVPYQLECSIAAMEER